MQFELARNIQHAWALCPERKLRDLIEEQAPSEFLEILIADYNAKVAFFASAAGEESDDLYEAVLLYIANELDLRCEITDMTICSKAEIISAVNDICEAHGANEIADICILDIVQTILTLEKSELSNAKALINSLITVDDDVMQEEFDETMRSGVFSPYGHMCIDMVEKFKPGVCHAIRRQLYHSIKSIAQIYGLKSIPPRSQLGWIWLIRELLERRYEKTPKTDRNVKPGDASREVVSEIRTKIYSDWKNHIQIILDAFGDPPDMAMLFKSMIEDGHYQRGGFMCHSAVDYADAQGYNEVWAQVVQCVIHRAMVIYAADRGVSENRPISWAGLIARIQGNRRGLHNSADHDIIDNALFDVYSNWDSRAKIFTDHGI